MSKFEKRIESLREAVRRGQASEEAVEHLIKTLTLAEALKLDRVMTPDEAQAAGISVRPMVRKHFQKFMDYVEKHGSQMVDDCLKKGQSGKARLTFFNNRKDRHQMRQLLGFEPMKGVEA